MLHELCQLITSHPEGSFVVIMTLIVCTYLLMKAFIERNKPVLECECECCDPEEEDDEEEVVAMGGEEEDHEPR